MLGGYAKNCASKNLEVTNDTLLASARAPSHELERYPKGQRKSGSGLGIDFAQIPWLRIQLWNDYFSTAAMYLDMKSKIPKYNPLHDRFGSGNVIYAIEAFHWKR